MSPHGSPGIAVAGDVWIDFVGLGTPRQQEENAPAQTHARRRTEEACTFILPGGALLLQTFIKAAVSPDAVVAGPRFGWLPALPKKRITPITWDELQNNAGRLIPKEMRRSLLSLMPFAETRGPNTKDARIRVEKALGFTGAPWPKLPVMRPASRRAANFVVLDDTHGQFRRHRKCWPVEIFKPAPRRLTVIHKLRGPFPSRRAKGLWKAASADPAQHIVIVSADDLRQEDISISRGLSWERTALDVVWHLLRRKEFEVLRSCRHLIVRLGIDGAIYWQSDGRDGPYKASLIYDPAGIEGNTEQSFNGMMVGYGSAFVAGMVKWIVNGGVDAIPDGIKAGLVAGCRLLKLGFGDAKEAPCYPATNKLFEPIDPDLGEAAKPEYYFACRKIPILSQATKVDPGYWRLLESAIAEDQEQLDDAVAQRQQFDALAKVAGGTSTHGVDLLRDAPYVAFSAFRTYDRREIEQYRALYSLMRDYVSAPKVARPLNVAVFGPPGAGKSFGIKEVAKFLHDSGVRVLAGESPPRTIQHLTFNLSQYKDPAELAAAFHQVRDWALRDEVPLVFFDEFDSTVNDARLGWLRYFLSPMQDGEFLDGGLSHPIGRAIFVFAGGTADSYKDFTEPETSGDSEEKRKFREAKGPDFLSRLRAVLDIHTLDLDPDFDAYGQVELFPCEAATRLRRADILASLGKKKPQLCDGKGKVYISEAVVDALLRVRHFHHGSRSLDALFDSSHLNDTREFLPSSLPSPDHVGLHMYADELEQWLMKPDVFADAYRKISAAIARDFPEPKPGKYKMEAVDVLRILRRAECTYARVNKSASVPDMPGLNDILSLCARREHDRWVADRRREGMVFGVSDDSNHRAHPWLVPWERLPREAQKHYSDRVFKIPRYLKEVGYVIALSSADWIVSGLKKLQRKRNVARQLRLTSPQTPE